MCAYDPEEVGFEEGGGDEKGVVRAGEGYIEKVLGENTDTSAFSFLAISGYCCLRAGGRDISTLR